MSRSLANVEVRCDWQVKLVWILTAALFASAICFAAFSGWAMTDKLADREVQLGQVQATANLNGEAKAAVDQLVLNNARLSALLTKAEKLLREHGL